MNLYIPIKPDILTQPFGGNPDYYARFKDHLGNPMKGHMNRYLSYFDLFPTTQPNFGKTSPGISSSLIGVSPVSSRQIQKKKSQGFSLFRRNDQTPACFPTTGFPRLFLREYRRADFTSINNPFFSKSLFPILKGKWFALSTFAAHFSHLNPIPVCESQKALSPLRNELPLVLRRYHALFMHFVEQYLGRTVEALQSKHFIYA